MQPSERSNLHLGPPSPMMLEKEYPQRPDYPGLRPPKSATSYFFWRCKIWVDATFVTSMLEPWETCVLFFLFFMFFFLLVGGMYYYLPSHVALLARRAQYYLVGTDSISAGGAGAVTWKDI